jgi:hypothetical protein
MDTSDGNDPQSAHEKGTGDVDACSNLSRHIDDHDLERYHPSMVKDEDGLAEREERATA